MSKFGLCIVELHEPIYMGVHVNKDEAVAYAVERTLDWLAGYGGEYQELAEEIHSKSLKNLFDEMAEFLKHDPDTVMFYSNTRNFFYLIFENDGVLNDFALYGKKIT